METCKIDRPILSDSSDDPVFNTIENFSKQTSVLKIKQARNPSDYFPFKLVNTEDRSMELLSSGASKTIQWDYISTKIMRHNFNNFS